MAGRTVATLRLRCAVAATVAVIVAVAVAVAVVVVVAVAVAEHGLRPPPSRPRLSRPHDCPRHDHDCNLQSHDSQPRLLLALKKLPSLFDAI